MPIRRCAMRAMQASDRDPTYAGWAVRRSESLLGTATRCQRPSPTRRLTLLAITKHRAVGRILMRRCATRALEPADRVLAYPLLRIPNPESRIPMTATPNDDRARPCPITPLEQAPSAHAARAAAPRHRSAQVRAHAAAPAGGRSDQPTRPAARIRPGPLRPVPSRRPPRQPSARSGGCPIRTAWSYSCRAGAHARGGRPGCRVSRGNCPAHPESSWCGRGGRSVPGAGPAPAGCRRRSRC
jgi:hypothetical protein